MKTMNRDWSTVQCSRNSKLDIVGSTKVWCGGTIRRVQQLWTIADVSKQFAAISDLKWRG